MSTSVNNRQRLPTSPFVRQCLKRIVPMVGAALDLPSGLGRHIELLASAGLFVVAGDIDRSRLLAAQQSGAGRVEGPAVVSVQLDANLPLPFLARVFELVLVIHPPFTAVIFNAAPTVRRGGHLIVETFGAQGENWRALPPPGQVKALLSADFDVLLYREVAVRRCPDAVAVKGLFRRR